MTTKKYWYICDLHECPVCGHSEKYRERVYKKPKTYWSYTVAYDYCLERDIRL